MKTFGPLRTPTSSGLFYFNSMDIYSLSRSFWDYAFENPDKVKPNHCALYFFSIEHCNRLGWKAKFGLPSTMVMEAIGIKSYNTYIKTFNDLIDFGFFILHEKSKNQYSSNVIALSKFDKANNKALDKALIKHATKQLQSTQQSIDSIDIQYTSIPINNNNNRAFVADANLDEKKYRMYLFDLISQKKISRDQLFTKCKIDISRRSELWQDFINNSIVNVPRIEDDKHAWNTFKKFIEDNKSKYQIKNSLSRNPE